MATTFSTSEVMTLWRYTNLLLLLFFFTPVLNSQGRKNYAMQYKKVQKSSWNEPYSFSLLPQYSRLISTTHFLDNLMGLCFEPFSFLDMPGFL